MPRMVRADSFRLVGLYVALFVSSASLLGAAVFLQARAALERQIEARILVETRFMQAQFREGRDVLTRSIDVRGTGVSALDYLLQDRTGAHLAGEIPAQPGLRPGWATLYVPEITEFGGRPQRMHALAVDLGGGLLLAVAANIGQVEDLEQAITRAFALTVGPAALLSLAGGLMLSRTFLRKVDAIGRTAEAIIAGDLSQRIPTRGTGDDLDRLAGTLNRMLDRIAMLMDSLHQVSSEVAHDLRTPLSRLYQRLEGARRHARSLSEYESVVDAALAEADALLATFAALLRIAQVEGRTRTAPVTLLDIAELAGTVVDAFRPDAEASLHRLRVAPAPPTMVVGDRELLTQSIANLVENAMRYTPGGTRIDVSVARAGDEVEILVVDNGPGVPQADLPKLGRRFFRAEQSRTTPGNGLGLALVSAVADLHGGELRFSRGHPGLRVRFSVSLALAGNIGKNHTSPGWKSSD